MLEAARSAPDHRAEGTNGRRARTRRIGSSEPRRDLLARLSVMSRAEPDHSADVPPGSTAEAAAVARAWLDLIHSDRSASSWAVAAPTLRETIDPEEWRMALRSVRVALGRCHSRRLHSLAIFDTFPGVPPGPYTVIRFESGFEERGGVMETVTTRLGEDGHWRVASYFVR